MTSSGKGVAQIGQMPFAPTKMASRTQLQDSHPSIVHGGNLTYDKSDFLVHPDVRGTGLGRELLRKALAFCRDRQFKSVFLWTISDLKAAEHLYQEAGFRRTDQNTHGIWGSVRTEERYDLGL